MIILAFLAGSPPQTQANLTDIPCSQCHSPNAWDPLDPDMKFNHNRETLFTLDGQHAEANCIQCHPGDNNTEIHAFSKAKPECNTCHMDIHQNQFGSTCEECHNTRDWDMSRWNKNHIHTLFQIDGAHAALDCQDCHGLNFRNMVGQLTTDCYTCHRQIFEAVLANDHTENHDCKFCHNTRAWLPLDLSQHDSIFRIYSGRHKGTWTTCSAECHYAEPDYTVFSCGLEDGHGFSCHAHNKADMDRKHRGEVGDYRYDSNNCFNCHGNGGGFGGD